MTVVAVIQARLGSTRLPRKVLLQLGGRTMLEQVVARVRQATRVDETVVATTDRDVDDALAALCREVDIPVFRGSEGDVLDRYYRAATEFQAGTIVRITSDCPLIDPSVIDMVVERLSETGADYASNILPERTFPRGLDTEAMTFAALERAWTDDRDPATREHVTPYLYRHPEIFRLTGVTMEPNLSEHRWTVDTPEDYELLRRVYEASSGAPGKAAQILALVAEHPDWRSLNEHVQQKIV